MKIKTFLSAAALLLGVNTLHAQMVLTMDKAMELSIQQNPDMLTAEMNLERYELLLVAQRASLKSKFSLSVTPASYSNSRYMNSETSVWYTNESFSSSGTFSISQPIMLTGATLSLNNKLSWQNSSSTIDGGSSNTSQKFSNSLYLSLNQPLFTYNDLKYDLLGIEMDYENAIISYALSRMSLEQRIISQFYSVYMAQQNLEIAQEEFENTQKSYEIIKEKVRLDMVTRSELYQAEINLASAESTLSTREVSLESAQDNFKQMLGLPLDTDFVVDAEIVETKYVNLDIDQAIDYALANRLELIQREITNIEADISLMQTKDNGSFDGSLSLSFGVMGDDPSFPNIYESPTLSPGVSLSLSIPIFDWGARKSRISAQELQMDMNKITEEQELLDIEIEVKTCCRSINNLIRQLEIAKKSLENAELTYDLNVEYYRAGEITGMEMNELQTQLSSQKISYMQAIVNYRLELIDLKTVTLYDFENDEPISPLLMYRSDAMAEMKIYNEKMLNK